MVLLAERRFVKQFGSYRIVVSIIGESDNPAEIQAIQRFIEQLISQGFSEDVSQEEETAA
ncbi:hypothetical protein B9Q13_02690 [Candidatus Marsarchaeota G2 archaeon ECH_B_SAG-G16]|uniref:Uncharacterized protein n=1 Tax=Candidatus Marsarchaeota G2 archaeon ECH_B_SAG-G16 TaxID=1978167 RepID=A0A2R6C2P3_9ARCH|nr:MAG: hypothetical protein B9Q13_02690 [Candidatus Marsarchaeota G2 archaeon ECH_B_SAG-G16]